MDDPFGDLCERLRRLPGLGRRSAERLALHLLTEDREGLQDLILALRTASEAVGTCPRCGNLAPSGALCTICERPDRDGSTVCVVEKVQDLIAIENASVWRGVYHVLHGKLSPLRNRGPETVNLSGLGERLAAGDIRELVLALGNDIEGEATCHYILDTHVPAEGVRVSRIGFGLPSGGELTYADAVTLRNALDGRRSFLREG